MHKCPRIFHGPLHVLSFCGEVDILLQRADRNGAGVLGPDRLALQGVFQIMPIEQIFFIVVQWVNMGSEDIVIRVPGGLQVCVCE